MLLRSRWSGCSFVGITIDARSSLGSPKAFPEQFASNVISSSPLRNGASVAVPENFHHADKAQEIVVNGHLSDDGLAGDVMDISRSDIDEGEITDYSPESPVVQQSQADPTEQEEVYEPPPTIGTKLALPSEAVELLEPKQTPLLTTLLTAQAEAGDTVDGTSLIPQDASVVRSTDIKFDGGTKMPASHSQDSFTKSIDDSDDYEPPEPVSPSTNGLVAIDKETLDPKLSESTIQQNHHANPTEQHQSLTQGLRDTPEAAVEGAELQPKETVRPLPFPLQGAYPVYRQQMSYTGRTTSPHMKVRSGYSSHIVTILPTLLT